MTKKELVNIIEEVVEYAPSWLKDDVNEIVDKSNEPIRNSYVISELYKRYTFGMRHIASSMIQSSEWSMVAHDRLNFIDHNIDLIMYMLERMKKSS